MSVPVLFFGTTAAFSSGGVVSALVFNAQEEARLPTPMVTVHASGTKPYELTYGSHPRLADRNFFASTKQAMQSNATSFIAADLTSMEISYYEDGQRAFSAPILSKGREGSWWETPAGLYEIKLKKENHRSSFGGVYQPWSMVFQGNFFIHGWPYHPDGTPVRSDYSGGCIRLANEDARVLFEQVAVGTPVLVYERTHEDDVTYAAPLPEIDANAYLVADLRNGRVLASKNVEEVLPIASITKLMTALVAAEHINLDTNVTITSSDLASTTVPRLREGMSLSAYGLLEPLLRESSNSAARALANQVGRERFVSLMNAKARAVGMQHTHFTDVAGILRSNRATAEDLFRLARHLHENRSFLLRLSTNEVVSSAYEGHPFGSLASRQAIDELPAFAGGMRGSTAAGETALMVYQFRFQDTMRPIAFIVLGGEESVAAIRTLHRYVTDHFALYAS